VIDATFFPVFLSIAETFKIQAMIVDPSNMLCGNHGKIGKTVYQRVVNGKTILQKCPEHKKIKVGPDMPINNKRFYFATKWAVAIRKNKEVDAQYKAVARGTNSAYSMAVKDYMTQPVIRSVSSDDYHGRPGERIEIQIDNVIRVKAVKVTIENPDGSVLENDLASPGRSAAEWHYTTHQYNPHLSGTTLRIEAWDLPNHRVEWLRVY